MAELKIKADSGGGTVSFKGPASTTGDNPIQLTLPVDDGTANQVLTTNGSGALSWAAPVIADDSIIEAKLDIHAAPTGTDKFLGYTSNGMEWTTVATGVSSDAQRNTIAGTNAGEDFDGTNPTDNTLYGYDAGKDITTGDHNTCIGTYAGRAMTTGGTNIFIGKESGGTGVVTGSDNICVGTNTGEKIDSGIGNVIMGHKAGHEITSGQYNVCIGNEAGHGQITTEVKRLYIARGNGGAGSNKTWIVGVDTGACNQGNNSSSWATTSDERLKKNIADNTAGLSIIDNVKVRTFEYRTEAEIDRSQFSVTTTKDENGDYLQTLALGHTGSRLGIIAQELETIAPRCVTTDERGVKAVDQDDLFWNLITAVQELSAKVKALEAG